MTAAGKGNWAGIPRAQVGKPPTKQLGLGSNTATIQRRKGTSNSGSAQLEFPFMCLYKQQHRSFSTAFLHSSPSFFKFMSHKEKQRNSIFLISERNLLKDSFKIIIFFYLKIGKNQIIFIYLGVFSFLNVKLHKNTVPYKPII